MRMAQIFSIFKLRQILGHTLIPYPAVPLFINPNKLMVESKDFNFHSGEGQECR
jgi:hypothetical protein